MNNIIEIMKPAPIAYYNIIIKNIAFLIFHLKMKNLNHVFSKNLMIIDITQSEENSKINEI